MAKSRSRSARKRPTSASKAKSTSGRLAGREEEEERETRGRHCQFETSVRRDRTQDSGASADRERRRTRQARDQGTRGLPAGIQPLVPAFDGLPDQGSEHHAVIVVPEGFRRIRVRRSPHLVSYWRGASIILHNYATGDVVKATPLVSALLNSCTDWREMSSVAAELQASPALTRQLLGHLVARHLLHRSDWALDPRERAMLAFRHWNPAAGFFHTATKNVPFTSSRLAEAALLRQARTWPMPAPRSARDARRSCRCRTSSEPDSSRTSCLPDAHGGGFPPDPWPPASIDGAGTVRRHPAMGAHERGQNGVEDVPSGGARHPIECYVCVRPSRVFGPGCTTTHLIRTGLEKLRGGDMTARVRAWMPRSEYFAKAAFVILLTAVFERQLWRYPYARAYRAALVEAGHVCQTFCLTATWLGLAPSA